MKSLNKLFTFADIPHCPPSSGLNDLENEVETLGDSLIPGTSVEITFLRLIFVAISGKVE